jgi:hypothetical protein
MNTNHPPAENPEPQKLAEVFESLSTLRGTAQEERADYLRTVRAMGEECVKLRDAVLDISGTLHGRGGTTVYSGEPGAQVEGLLVRVGSARVVTHEGIIGFPKEHLPVVDITAWTLENDEMVCAWLGNGEYGVTAALLETRPVQT